MNRIQLHDNKGHLTGWIETVNDCKKIRNSKGTLLGWYEPSSDKTVLC